jgi:hypothetical protein
MKIQYTLFFTLFLISGLLSCKDKPVKFVELQLLVDVMPPNYKQEILSRITKVYSNDSFTIYPLIEIRNPLLDTAQWITHKPDRVLQANEENVYFLNGELKRQLDSFVLDSNFYKLFRHSTQAVNSELNESKNLYPVKYISCKVLNSKQATSSNETKLLEEFVTQQLTTKLLPDKIVVGLEFSKNTTKHLKRTRPNSGVTEDRHIPASVSTKRHIQREQILTKALLKKSTDYNLWYARSIIYFQLNDILKGQADLEQAARVAIQFDKSQELLHKIELQKKTELATLFNTQPKRMEGLVLALKLKQECLLGVILNQLFLRKNTAYQELFMVIGGKAFISQQAEFRLALLKKVGSDIEINLILDAANEDEPLKIQKHLESGNSLKYQDTNWNVDLINQSEADCPLAHLLVKIDTKNKNLGIRN